jgi:glycosyltransferase involved in cell wall biosynthesis
MKISIITVCYNAEKTIEKTIESIIAQSYKDLEYIIIDGASTDKTLEIIERYKKILPIILVSEKDNGIYDAMNKGTDLASGDYLNFMNAGDTFFNSTVIADVIPFLGENYDIVYGNMEVIYRDFKLIKKEPEPKYLWQGPVNHQSSFIKRETLKKYRYNTDNKLVADFEFFLNVYYQGGKIKKINETIASYSNDGVTQVNDKQVIEDCYKTVKLFRDDLTVKIYYTFLKIKPGLKKILPRSLFKFLKSSLN